MIPHRIRIKLAIRLAYVVLLVVALAIGLAVEAWASGPAVAGNLSVMAIAAR